MTVPPTVPPGWYPDPTDPAWQRWWDGRTWTEHAAPASASQNAQQSVAPITAQAPVSGDTQPVTGVTPDEVALAGQAATAEIPTVASDTARWARLSSRLTRQVLRGPPWGRPAACATTAARRVRCHGCQWFRGPAGREVETTGVATLVGDYCCCAGPIVVISSIVSNNSKKGGTAAASDTSTTHQSSPSSPSLSSSPRRPRRRPALRRSRQQRVRRSQHPRSCRARSASGSSTTTWPSR